MWRQKNSLPLYRVIIIWKLGGFCELLTRIRFECLKKKFPRPLYITYRVMLNKMRVVWKRVYSNFKNGFFFYYLPHLLQWSFYTRYWMERRTIRVNAPERPCLNKINKLVNTYLIIFYLQEKLLMAHAVNEIS